MTPAQSKIKQWKNDPVSFVREVFKVEPDQWQVKGLKAFADPSISRIGFSACAGPGKSAELCFCGWNFLLCYADKGEHPKAAATSISGDNLRDNLWAEMSKWQSRSPMLQSLFKVTSEKIFAVDHRETWFMAARTFPKTANAEEIGRTLSGMHGKYLLYLVDESGDISPNLMKSAEQGLSTGPKFGKILQAGNPTSHTGMLYTATTKLRDQWHMIRITGDPDDPERSPRIDIDWAREQIRQHGRDDPWVMAYILGQFPKSAINTLLTVEEVEIAMNRTFNQDMYAFSQKRLGIDVALGGLDKTIIFPRQGRAAFKFVEMNTTRPSDIAARVMKAKADWGSEIEFIDNTGGFGSGVIDSLQQAGEAPMPVHFSGAAIESQKYFNKRSEMWFNMADWIKSGGAIPNDPKLIKELTAPVYGFKNGLFKLEEKEQIKKRLGFSPDRADALALTFALPDMPAQMFNGLPVERSANKVAFEYDPYKMD